MYFIELEIIIIFAIENVANYQEITDSQIPVRLGNGCDLVVNNDREFALCRSRALEYWSTYSRTKGIKDICCFEWDLIDCQENSIYKWCDRAQYEDESKNFMTKKNQLIYLYENLQCIDYPYGSTSCRSSIKDVAFNLFGCILAISVLISICYYIRKRGRTKRYS